MNVLYHQRMSEKRTDPDMKTFHATLALRYQEHAKIFGEMYEDQVYDHLQLELRAFAITKIFEHSTEPEADKEELSKAQNEIMVEIPLSIESRKALDEGLRSAKENPEGIKLGSFAQYADDD